MNGFTVPLSQPFQYDNILRAPPPQPPQFNRLIDTVLSKLIFPIDKEGYMRRMHFPKSHDAMDDLTGTDSQLVVQHPHVNDPSLRAFTLHELDAWQSQEGRDEWLKALIAPAGYTGNQQAKICKECATNISGAVEYMRRYVNVTLNSPLMYH